MSTENSFRFKYAQNVSTGVGFVEHFFRWKICNFPLIFLEKDLIKKQKFQSTVADSVGRKCKWEFYLDVHEGEKSKQEVDGQLKVKQNWISIFGKVVENFSGSTEHWANFKVNVKHENGLDFYTAKTGTRDFKSGWGWNQFISMENDIAKLPLTTDRALLINIHLNLMSISSVPSLTNANSNSLLSPTILRLSKDYENLLSDQFDDISLSDVKLLSKDGKEFNCHRPILAARSSVFATLLRSKMKESTSGEVHLDDLTGETLQVILHYLYCGNILKEWSKPNVIIEFTYAAGKYQLREVLEFLDEMLGSYCSKETATKLLSLASKLSLENAEKQISSYIKEVIQSVETTDDLLAAVNDEAVC